MQQPHLRSTVRVHCGRGLHTRTATGEAGEVRGRARPPPELQLVLVEDRGCYMCSVCGPGWLGWRVVRLVRGRLPGPDWPPAAGLVVVVAPRQLGGSTHEPRL